jgi:3-oxoacyl-[acyl-carrier protein] reductase
MDLHGKVAFVTGASRGIGQATALALAQAGASLILHARKLENLDLTQAQLAQAGLAPAQLLAYEADDFQAVKEAFSSIQKTHKKLDILVNNAGMLEEGMLGMISNEQMERVLRVNVQSVLHHMQWAARLMSRAQAGSIINLTSIMGLRGAEGLLVYSSSKAAIVGATLAAAKELAPRNVRVNAVAPGFIETDMAAGLTPAKLQERLASIKMNRAGQPAEVAHAICFLASDRASYITGQVLGVDGGMVL